MRRLGELVEVRVVVGVDAAATATAAATGAIAEVVMEQRGGRGLLLALLLMHEQT